MVIRYLFSYVLFYNTAIAVFNELKTTNNKQERSEQLMIVLQI